MRLSALVAAWVCIGDFGGAAAGPPAATGDLAELDRVGEQLAKEGQYALAIEKFKAADRLQPSAAHACLIGLAYTRLERWPQAELWLARCDAGATASEPRPTWAAKVEQQVAAGLAASDVARVEIVVHPTNPDARISISTLPPDETLAQPAVHLPFGHHVITASAPGHVGQVAIDIRDKSPRQVIIELGKLKTTLEPAGGDGAPPQSPASAPPAQPARLPRRLIIVGAATVGAGFIAYGVMGYAWSKIESQQESNRDYGQYDPVYTASRVATVALWSVGAGLAITGYLLHRRDSHEALAFTLAPTPHGSLLTLDWRR